MELIENLLQLLTTFVGALLSGIFYRKSGRQAYFCLLYTSAGGSCGAVMGGDADSSGAGDDLVK